MSAPAPARRTLILGMLGGIASGKSYAAALLAGADGLVIDADRLAHEVLASDDVAARVRERFGEAALGPDGRPDRAALARIAFRDPEARKALEGWIHPRVRAMIDALVEGARARGVPRIVLDVPLLLENDGPDAQGRPGHGLVGLCDALVFVDADDAERARRARATRGWDRDELARREALQIPLEEKRRRADVVLPNHGDAEALAEAVRAALRRLPSGPLP